VDGHGDKEQAGANQTSAADVATMEMVDKIDGAIKGFQQELGAFPESSLQKAVADWASKLSSSLDELKDIVAAEREKSKDAGIEATARGTSEQDEVGEEDPPEVLHENVEKVKEVRHILESARTGREPDELTNAWADPEEAAKEVEELRRVRRQIRYIFGGMIQQLPDNTTLRVDDLISEIGEQEQAPKHASPHNRAHERPPPIPGVPIPEPQPTSKVPVPPQQRPEHAGARPRSGGTELSSVTDSSAVSWNSGATEDRSHRHGERKHRKHRRHRHESEDAKPTKKDDGALPKQWNWAEEVVKASLDPANQWQFPGPAKESVVAASGPGGYAAGPGQLAVWEQPRAARGTNVASRARERAEEVQRLERQNPQAQYLFGTPRR